MKKYVVDSLNKKISAIDIVNEDDDHYYTIEDCEAVEFGKNHVGNTPLEAYKKAMIIIMNNAINELEQFKLIDVNI